jgi:hypothetical protein
MGLNAGKTEDEKETIEWLTKSINQINEGIKILTEQRDQAKEAIKFLMDKSQENNGRSINDI